MAHLPILRRFDVSGYGLYPGSPGTGPGLHMEFRPGVTLLLGANGLGKTTALTLLYRMMSGPFDVPGLVGTGALGTARLRAAQLSPPERRTFAARVSDGARDAQARLQYSLASHTIVVGRSVANLSLTEFVVDGTPQAVDETSYQDTIAKLAGVWSFGDWILLLRQLVFYFEDRRELVWDPTAQRQVLRVLLLPPAVAQRWSADERSVLELDSQVRNLHNTLTGQEKALGRVESKADSAVDIRAELTLTETLQTADRERLAEAERLFADLDARREATRLRALTLSQERESRYRELERAKLVALQARFPSASDTARYVLSQLMADSECLACGQPAESARATFDERIGNGVCVVCAQPVPRVDPEVLADISDRRITRLETQLASLDDELHEAVRQRGEAVVEHEEHTTTVAGLRTAIAQRSVKIERLVRQLPPEEGVIHEQRRDLESLRGRLSTMRSDLAGKRAQFATFLAKTTETIMRRAAEIQTAFGGHADSFLMDSCRLVWAPHRSPLGQGGEILDFPAFAIEMASATSEVPLRREGPSQVSESQREFVDLAFRMALMQVADESGSGTLVVDAPESSLDAVFAKRAAEVLVSFGRANPENRLVVASNLVEGSLVPGLLGSDNDSFLVNLFEVARPTAAVRAHEGEYREYLAQLTGEIPQQ